MFVMFRCIWWILINLLHLPALIYNLHIAYNTQLHMSYMMHLQPWGVFLAIFFSIPSPRKCVVPGNGQLCKCAATVMEPAGSTAFSMKLWVEINDARSFLNLFYLKDVIMFHSGHLWTIHSFIQQKCHPRRFFWAKNPGSLIVSVGLSFWSWGTPCMFFMLCNRCHFGQSCGCCHATSRETKVNKPWKRGLTNPGLEQVTTYLVPNWKTVIMRQVMFILYRSHMRKKTFIKKNEDDDVYLKRIHRGYQVQCPVRWLASGHRSRQTLKKFRFTTAAHVPGFDAAGSSLPGGTWSRIWTLANF